MLIIKDKTLTRRRTGFPVFTVDQVVLFPKHNNCIEIDFYVYFFSIFQGAAATVQNVIRAGQRAATDVYVSGSGNSGQTRNKSDENGEIKFKTKKYMGKCKFQIDNYTFH